MLLNEKLKLLEDCKGLLDRDGFVQIGNEVFYIAENMDRAKRRLSDSLSWLLFELTADGKKYIVENSDVSHETDRYWPDAMGSYVQKKSLRQSVLIKEVPMRDFLAHRHPPLSVRASVSVEPTWAIIWSAIKKLAIKDFKLMCKGESLRKYSKE